MSGYVSLLDILYTGDDQRQAHHTHQRDQLRHPVEFRDPDGNKEHADVQQNADRKVEVEYGGEIQIIRIFFLDQRIAHTAVHKDLQDRGEHRYEGGDAVHRRIKQTRKDKGDDKGDALSAGTFQKAPDQIIKYLTFHSLTEAPVLLGNSLAKHFLSAEAKHEKQQ